MVEKRVNVLENLVPVDAHNVFCGIKWTVLLNFFFMQTYCQDMKERASFKRRNFVVNSKILYFNFH